MRPELFTIPGTHITVPSFGAMVMIGFLGGLWWMTRRTIKAKQDPDIVLNLGFIALIFMTIGARTFYVIHYWDTQFKHQPSQIFNLNSGGFEFYGGFIGAFVPCVLYAMYRKLSLRLWTDIMVPTLLFAMGVGRIGCFLAGCCHGAPCSPHLPWGVQFPIGSYPQVTSWQARSVSLPAELIFIPPDGVAVPMPPKGLAVSLTEVDEKLKKAAEAAEAARKSGCNQRADCLQGAHDKAEQSANLLRPHLEAFPTSVRDAARLNTRQDLRSPCLHPAQLYSAVGPLLLAWLTSALFYRRKRHGVVFAVGLMLYAVERFIEETIRVDNPADTLGLTISQAISVVVFIVMGTWLLVLQRLPLRSPRAVAFVPKDDKKKNDAAPTPA